MKETDSHEKMGRLVEVDGRAIDTITGIEYRLGQGVTQEQALKAQQEAIDALNMLEDTLKAPILSKIATAGWAATGAVVGFIAGNIPGAVAGAAAAPLLKGPLTRFVMSMWTPQLDSANRTLGNIDKARGAAA